MDKKIFTLGEIMLRISPLLTGEMIQQASFFRIEPGGSESNVAIALAQLGHKTAFLSKIPDNPHKKLVLRYLKQYDIDTSLVVIGGNRIGIYWTDNGLGPRATSVIYDREKSSFYDFEVKDFDWKAINKDAHWFHISGITPAISENLYKNTLLILNTLNKNIKVSVDLNYRHKLWHWIRGDRENRIKEIMYKLCFGAYLITGNESDLQRVFGFPLSRPSDINSYKKMAKVIFNKLANLRFLAISLRLCHSASQNDWGGILFVRGEKKIDCYQGTKYELSNIADRVGTGDSFTAGIIHGILCFHNDFQRTIDFAVALGALNHTTIGDASQFNERDVEEMMESKGSGSIIR